MQITSTPDAQVSYGAVSWSPTIYDHLPLPNGRRVGETDSSTLYTLFDKLGVAAFHHRLGRTAAIECYAAHLRAVGNAGSDSAIQTYLKEHS